MTTRSNQSDGGNRPTAGEVTGQKSFWFLLGRLPKETRRVSEATAKAFDFHPRSAAGNARAVCAQRKKPWSGSVARGSIKRLCPSSRAAGSQQAHWTFIPRSDIQTAIPKTHIIRL